jgi:hypothetical protein
MLKHRKIEFKIAYDVGMKMGPLCNVENVLPRDQVQHMKDLSSVPGRSEQVIVIDFFTYYGECAHATR